ncbi:hypothetical protein RclHR1_01740033 [Rhizophagus clarus]|uniref:Transcription factor Pcr1 n=1 Tax=Rhizophagus clarus TaxID=94130 RepID=A0A2Z6RCU1_9GLOM|nr:hypothetical protein RclHR1_01740033 [Rhizophagus clarus]GES81773.1 transcription factor Pcr1 [Rhizophagus clarus]
MFADMENLLIKTNSLYETDIMEKNSKSHNKRLFSQAEFSGLEIKTQPDYHITAEPYVSFSELSYLISPATAVSYGQALTTVMTTPSSVTYKYSPGRVLNPVSTSVTKAISMSTEIINSPTESSGDRYRETPEEKRAKRLERNRIAVAKYRIKQREHIKRLKEQDIHLTQMNTALRSLVIDLRKESINLKLQILAHSGCDCDIMRDYVRINEMI